MKFVMDSSGSVEVVVVRMLLTVGALVIVHASKIVHIPQEKIDML